MASGGFVQQSSNQEGRMIDISKKYRTRDGREVRIYATDMRGVWPIHGAINFKDNWSILSWMQDGRCYKDGESQFDLIEVKPRHKRTVWLNVYSEPAASFGYGSKRDADHGACLGRVACIKVELDFEEGEGL